MNPIQLSIDVTTSLPEEVNKGADASLAGWLFLPDDPATLPDRPTLLVLLNGGTYDKRYWHAVIDGHPGYSAAEHLARNGNIVVALDHLCIGESTRVANQMLVTRHVAATATHRAVEEIVDRLMTGTLHESLRPFDDVVTVGCGHAMGGMQIITGQAEHATFDCVAILGYTAIGVHLTARGELVSAHPQTLDPNADDYLLVDRASLHETFHWDDVPAAVRAADDRLAVEVPYKLSRQSMRRGIVADDVPRITVPVYLCFGERDVSPNPHAEPGLYTGSGDVTLHVLTRSGHCHNFASTRAVVWNRIHDWVTALRLQARVRPTRHELTTSTWFRRAAG